MPINLDILNVQKYLNIWIRFPFSPQQKASFVKIGKYSQIFQSSTYVIERIPPENYLRSKKILAAWVQRKNPSIGLKGPVLEAAQRVSSVLKQDLDHFSPDHVLYQLRDRKKPWTIWGYMSLQTQNVAIPFHSQSMEEGAVKICHLVKNPMAPRGVGASLVQYAIFYAQNIARKNYVYLETDEGARGFYERQNFHLLGTQGVDGTPMLYPLPFSKRQL